MSVRSSPALADVRAAEYAPTARPFPAVGVAGRPADLALHRAAAYNDGAQWHMGFRAGSGRDCWGRSGGALGDGVWRLDERAVRAGEVPPDDTAHHAA